MKKISVIILALLLLCSIAVSASAQENYFYNYSDNELFTEDEKAKLDTEMSEFTRLYDMKLYFIVKSGSPETNGRAYSDSFISEHGLNTGEVGGVIMVYDLDTPEFGCYTYGFCDDIFTDGEKTEILKTLDLHYDNTKNTYNYYAMYSNIISDVSYFYSSKRPNTLGEYAPNYYYGAPDSKGAFVTDDADLFTDVQEAALLAKIETMRAKYNNDFVLHTTNSLGGKSVVDYADDYYDYNGYANDGLMFMVCMAGGEGNRDYYTSTKGKAINIFNDYARGRTEDEVVDLLISGDYYGAFDEYLNMVDIIYAKAETGKPYDYNNKFLSTNDIFTYEIISLVSAAFAAFIVLQVMKSKMNTAIKKSDARDYVVPGSLNITDGQDVFTHSTVAKTAIQKSGSSGGGGSHSSSSGSSHGGGGGKF